MENLRKHKDIKLFTTERRRKYLVSEPYYCTTKFLQKIYYQLKFKKFRYLWVLILYEFWCDYVKAKYGEKEKMYHINTDSFIVYIKTNWYLPRHCIRCWNYIWHFKLWIR